VPPGKKRNSDKLKMNSIHNEALMEDRSVRRAGLRLHVIRTDKQNFESGERSMSL
jgi:hypothetical protein